MDKVKVVMKSKGKSIEEIIDEAVNGLDALTDESIKSRILGLVDSTEDGDEELAESEVVSEESSDDMDEETKRKLLELLSKES